jgi:hypothetical protein
MIGASRFNHQKEQMVQKVIYADFLPMLPGDIGHKSELPKHQGRVMIDSNSRRWMLRCSVKSMKQFFRKFH